MDEISNNLVICYPHILDFWDYESNVGILPEKFFRKSNKKVWWKCKVCEYRWEAKIGNFTRNICCPNCNGNILNKNNCLAFVYPEIIKKWNIEKNGSLTPYDVFSSSAKKVWWKCLECGHNYIRAINSMVKIKKYECEKCNSVAINRPKLLKYWHPTKNSNLDPYIVSKKSSELIWWLCHKCGYEWQSSIFNLGENDNIKCKRCYSAGMINNKLINQWHPTKNGKLTPFDVANNNKNKYWFLCDKCGFEWQGTLYSKNRQKRCQLCNSLWKNYPKIASEWHPTKNGNLTPYNVGWGSIKDIWWKCLECGHEWKARPESRCMGCGCPDCKKIIINDGTKCDSILDAFFYLKFKEKNIKFEYNNKYGGLGKKGKCRYDFYLPDKDIYLEVTAFNKKEKFWFRYLRNIVRKKRFVENNGHKFKFIKKVLSRQEVNYVRDNMLKYNTGDNNEN